MLHAPAMFEPNAPLESPLKRLKPNLTLGAGLCVARDPVDAALCATPMPDDVAGVRSLSPPPQVPDVIDLTGDSSDDDACPGSTDDRKHVVVLAEARADVRAVHKALQLRLLALGSAAASDQLPIILGMMEEVQAVAAQGLACVVQGLLNKRGASCRVVVHVEFVPVAEWLRERLGRDRVRVVRHRSGAAQEEEDVAGAPVTVTTDPGVFRALALAGAVPVKLASVSLELPDAVQQACYTVSYVCSMMAIGAIKPGLTVCHTENQVAAGLW